MKDKLIKFLKNLFEPFGKLTKYQKIGLIVIQVIVFLSLWEVCAGGFIPKPTQIGKAWVELINNPNISYWNSVYNSFVLSIKVLIMSVGISAILMYLSTIQFFDPMIKFISQLRFLTISALVPIFIFMIKDPANMKIAALLVGIVTFFVSSLLVVVRESSQQERDLCMTLKMNRWETLYHTIIVGKLRDLCNVLVTNMAISYTLISTVETICMSEDSLGALIFKEQKYLHMDKVFALLASIMIIGLLLVLFGNLLVSLFNYNKKWSWASLGQLQVVLPQVAIQ